MALCASTARGDGRHCPLQLLLYGLELEQNSCPVLGLNLEGAGSALGPRAAAPTAHTHGHLSHLAVGVEWEGAVG